VQEEIDRDLGLFRCAKCERLYDPEELPVYHDSEGWMYPETIRKIIKKMPDTLIHYLQDIWANPDGGEYNDYMIPKTRRMFSLSNFLAYLKDHLDDWAMVECPTCRGRGKVYEHCYDGSQVLVRCQGKCNGTDKIINPEYEEALKEMEVERSKNEVQI
jgi:hypothetical protein